MENSYFYDKTFGGEGTKFNCKLVGITDVVCHEGGDMCAEAFKQLKVQAKKKKEHKQKVALFVSLADVRIVDENTQKVQYVHPVKKISYVTLDHDESKTFGYVCSQPNCPTGYQFYALKSEENAQVIVDAMVELFQVSFNRRQDHARSAKKQVPHSSHHVLNGSVEFIAQLQQMKLDASKVNDKKDLKTELKKIASEKGFRIVDNEGSGNCMFYALSNQLEIVMRIKIKHDELRQILVQYLRKNPELPNGTNLCHFVHGHQSWADYLTYMEQDGAWGDHVILCAAANCYKTCIRVVSSLNAAHDVILRPQCPVDKNSTLVLGHIHEVHYVSLHSTQGSVELIAQLQQMKLDASKVSDKKDLKIELKKIASDKGFRIVDNEGSGNCMFYALSNQLEIVMRIKIKHDELRQILVQYLRKNPELPKGTNLFHFVHGHQSWADYLTYMEQDGAWGDHVILCAAANCYKTCIRVVSSLNAAHDVILRPQCPVDKSSTLVLGHIHEVHYVSLHSTQVEEQLAHSQGQLREKELEQANLLREKEQQHNTLHQKLTNLEGQLREKESLMDSMQEQLNRKIQQVGNLEEQLKTKDRERIEIEKSLSAAQSALRVHRAQVVTLERQLMTKDQEKHELERTLAAAQQVLRAESQTQNLPDWAIPRDQIQLTEKILGRGAWGEVVEGKYCGYAVAVKRIHNIIISLYNRRLFEREMDIASRCRHPCLLQFIGTTNIGGRPMIVTELMETSLRALLERRSLSETEVSVISLDVARALSYLHQKRPSPILHRDISSANVLLCRQGNQWRAKVSDYGTANFKQQTMTVAPGTPIYSAPEAHTPNQTPKLDVYSFGVLLCEMCIRELPDPGRREQQVAMVTQNVLRALIRRCLQPMPQARPSMQQIIDELEQSS